MAPNKRKREDSSDDEDIAPGRQILPVANLPLDFEGDPSDGMQYLFTVRRDARKLPHVTRVSNPYEKVTVLPPSRNYDAPGTHPDLPSDEWRAVFETHFRNFRKNMSQPTISVHVPRSNAQILMPDKKERDRWWAFLAGKPESEWNPPKQPKKPKRRGMRAFADDMDVEDEGLVTQETWRINEEGEVELALRVDPAESLPTPSGSPAPAGMMVGDAPEASGSALLPRYRPREPTPSLLKRIDERMSLHLLMYFTHWINIHLQPKSTTPFPRPTQAHARWIFVLLALIDDHISADDMNLLRTLVRSCTSLLKSIRSETSSDNPSALPNPSKSASEVTGCDPMDETSCWIIISTVAGIWGQRDLWMEAEDMLKSIRAST